MIIYVRYDVEGWSVQQFTVACNFLLLIESETSHKIVQLVVIINENIKYIFF